MDIVYLHSNFWFADNVSDLKKINFKNVAITPPMVFFFLLWWVITSKESSIPPFTETNQQNNKLTEDNFCHLTQVGQIPLQGQVWFHHQKQ